MSEYGPEAAGSMKPNKRGYQPGAQDWMPPAESNPVKVGFYTKASSF